MHVYMYIYRARIWWEELYCEKSEKMRCMLLIQIEQWEINVVHVTFNSFLFSPKKKSFQISEKPFERVSISLSSFPLSLYSFLSSWFLQQASTEILARFHSLCKFIYLWMHEFQFGVLVYNRWWTLNCSSSAICCSSFWLKVQLGLVWAEIC